MVVWSILSSLITIFILIIPGFLFCKGKVLTKEQTDGINSLIVNLTWPCLVIDGMQMEYSSQIMKDSLYTLGLCMAGFVLICGMMGVFSKAAKWNKSRQFLICFMLLFGNTGFIGIPVLKALYGGEAVFYAAVIELINDILIFTVGILLIQKSAGVTLKMQWRELFSPGMVGVILGLGLFLFEIKLPDFIGQAVSMLGNATTPLTMFMIGVQLGGISWRELLRDSQVYLVSLLKLILIPVLFFLLLRIWKPEFSLLEKCIILSFAMPMGSVAAIFSKKYDSDAVFAAKSVLLSTVFCILTIPVFALLMEL